MFYYYLRIRTQCLHACIEIAMKRRKRVCVCAWERENEWMCESYTNYYVSEYILHGIDDIIEIALPYIRHTLLYTMISVLFTHHGVSLLRLVLFNVAIKSDRILGLHTHIHTKTHIFHGFFMVFEWNSMSAPCGNSIKINSIVFFLVEIAYIL